MNIFFEHTHSCSSKMSDFLFHQYPLVKLILFMVKLEARSASHSHPDLYVSDLERGVLIGRNLDEEEESHHADTLPGSIVGHTMT